LGEKQTPQIAAVAAADDPKRSSGDRATAFKAEVAGSNPAGVATTIIEMFNLNDLEPVCNLGSQGL
jgi:hypothetical protein